MNVYASNDKINILFHITKDYNVWNIEVFDNFKLIKKGLIIEDNAKNILYENRIIKDEELEVVKAKLCLMAP